MRPMRLLLSTTLLALGLAVPLQAQPTVEDLDQRLRAVEGNLQEILMLLKGQQEAEPAAAQEAQAPVVPTGYQWGALFLDVFSSPMSDQDVRNIWNARENVPDAPSNAPLESILVQVPSAFKWGALLDDAKTAKYAKSEGNLRIQWSGVFHAIKDGEHTFVANLSRESGREGPAACRGIVKLNEKPVLDIRVYAAQDQSGAYEYAAFNVNEQGKVSLAPGVYDFSFFLTCLGNNEEAMKNTVATLRLIEPGDRAPKPIPPERFGIRM